MPTLTLARRLCLVVPVLTMLGVSCAAPPGPAGQDQLAFQGAVQSMTGEPAQDRLVVVFLDGKEAGRSVTRCQGADCAFSVGVPNAYQLAGHAPSGSGPARIEVGLVPEGESRTFPAVATPDELNRTQHVYVVQVLAGPQTSLPPEFQAERLGLLPDGGVVVIGGPPPGVTTPTALAQPETRLMVALALALACGSGLVALAAGVTLVILWSRWTRTVTG
jgi:hypothetical protein